MLRGGAELGPSNGGVFGAQYIHPTVIVRPRRWLDPKGGMVVAQATSDVVDPYRLQAGGSYVNYRGGNPRRKDLGLELDARVDARIPLENAVKAIAGVQSGVLFPGGALEDARGSCSDRPRELDQVRRPRERDRSRRDVGWRPSWILAVGAGRSRAERKESVAWRVELR